LATRVFDKNELIGATLRQVALFATWPADVMATMASRSQLWRFAKGEALYEIGKPARGILVLVDGSLIEGRTSPNGKTMAVTIIRPNWPLCVRSCWGGGEHVSDGIARSDLLAVLIPPAEFRAAVGGNPRRLEDLIDFFCVQTGQDIIALQARALSSPRCMMAMYLSYLSRPTYHVSAEDPGAADPTAFAVTQDELAAMLFCSRQSVNQMMKAMEREGVLRREGNQLRIVSFLKLLAIMEEDEPIHPLWREQIVAWDAKLRAAETERDGRRRGSQPAETTLREPERR